jgi:hypothetical protein
VDFTHLHGCPAALLHKSGQLVSAFSATAHFLLNQPFNLRIRCWHFLLAIRNGSG